MHTPESHASRRQPNPYRGLLALNAGLIVVLALVSFGPGARAQGPALTAPPTRSRGQYTMVTAVIQGQTEAGIVVVDSANQEMVALRWDRSRKALQPLGYRDLEADAQMRRRPGR